MDGMRTGMERMVGADRGLGEESLQGQGTPTGRSFRLVRACGAQSYSCRIRDEMTVLTSSLFSFGLGAISLFPSGFINVV